MSERSRGHSSSSTASTRRWAVLTLASMLLFSNYYAYDLPAPLSPSLQAYLGYSDAYHQYFINVLYSVYSLPNIILPLLGGPLIDLFGTSRLVVVLSGVMCVGQLAFAAGVSSRDLTLMLAGRTLFGLGGETLSVAQTSLITKHFAGRELAFAMGLNLSIGRLGSVANDLVSPWVAVHWSLPGAIWLGTLTVAVSFACACGLAYLDAAGEEDEEEDDDDDKGEEERPLLHVEMRHGSISTGLGESVGSFVTATSPASVNVHGPDFDGSLGKTSTTNGFIEFARPGGLRRSSRSTAISKKTSFLDTSTASGNGFSRGMPNDPPGDLHISNNGYSEFDYHDPSTATLADLPPLGPSHSRPPHSIRAQPSALSVATGTSTFSLPADDSVRMSEIFNFTREFWLLCLVLVFCYATVSPFNNIHASFLRLKWYPDDPATAGQIMGIPDTISAILAAPAGLFVDTFGHRTELLILCGLVISSVHIILASVPIPATGSWAPSPVPLLAILGVAYCLLITVWACVPIVVSKKGVGTAFGLSTSLLNATLTLFPLLVARLVSIDPTFSLVENTFATSASLGSLAALLLWRLDSGGNLARPQKVKRRRKESGASLSRGESSSGGLRVDRNVPPPSPSLSQIGNLKYEAVLERRESLVTASGATGGPTRGLGLFRGERHEYARLNDTEVPRDADGVSDGGSIGPTE
ncbi:MFS general substrate transporter [Gonapodya prolifera JEL478]|uniref:Lysosomal dipeptide transporter MFSD1 n=1 Tax=Gonapodya prolifera (strain JEL478) TaxID=1344416 RepID=A0A139ACA7_GONPJ|nr:MFS general substrate transporter [Gonapodya prolifera JEL478]|eukprot:KXS14105.1 MFS general substrate transporter [Gonapodya prolifera JEL478]